MKLPKMKQVPEVAKEVWTVTPTTEMAGSLQVFCAGLRATDGKDNWHQSCEGPDFPSGNQRNTQRKVYSLWPSEKYLTVTTPIRKPTCFIHLIVNSKEKS